MNNNIEYLPELYRDMEIILVEMLQDQRGWNNYIEIYKALENIRSNAKSMIKEQEMLRRNDDQCSQAIDSK